MILAVTWDMKSAVFVGLSRLCMRGAVGGEGCRHRRASGMECARFASVKGKGERLRASGKTRTGIYVGERASGREDDIETNTCR